MSAPLAPWELAGESIVGLARWRGSSRHGCPWGCVACRGRPWSRRRATASHPWGHSSSSWSGTPPRLGLRFGWHISEAVVTEADARLGGRLNWGFPSDMADLSWEIDGEERAVVWPSRGLTVRGRPRGMPLPWLVPVRALQRRSDGCVIVPGHQRGRARPGAGASWKPNPMTVSPPSRAAIRA